MENYGSVCPTMATTPKAFSLKAHTALIQCNLDFPIPWPKSYAGQDSTQLLKETHLVLYARHNLTTAAIRNLMRGGNAVSIPDLPDVWVLFCPALIET